MGQKQTFELTSEMSALLPKADVEIAAAATFGGGSGTRLLPAANASVSRPLISAARRLTDTVKVKIYFDVPATLLSYLDRFFDVLSGEFRIN